MDSFTLHIAVPFIIRLYVTQVPIYIAWIIGLRFAVQMMHRERPGARTVFWAIAIQFCTSLLYVPLSFLLTWTFLRRGIDETIGNNIGTGIGILYSTIHAIAWLMILVTLARHAEWRNVTPSSSSIE